MERDEIEDVVHASLGRHLRVTSVLGLLFLGVGFVLGHYVSAQHARELSDQSIRRTEDLLGQVEKMNSELKEHVEAELASIRDESEDSVRQILEKKPEHEELVSETRRLARATEDLRQSLIARCIEQTEQERVRLLSELQPYLDRKMTLKATEVSVAVSRLVDLQVQQLKALASGEMSSNTPSAVQFKSVIAPVSGEANRTPLTTSNPSLLPVPAEASAPEARETASLAPLPPSITRTPAVAEPGPLQTATQKFFTTPRKPQLFIPARRSAALPTENGSAIR